ncbi:MAG: branched-chain amino acid ABC transporter permease [Desulfomonile tiedjei]|nr:branched-chain amino acid ABC transporter permease [Desulfomonile tiedjei]
MAEKNFLRENWPYVLLLVLALILPFVITNRYAFQIVIMGCLFSICTLSLNLILGYTGQASLAHAAFFGIGSYGVAILTKSGLSFWLALPLSALLAALVGFLIGLPTLRTRGSYFAIATLCFGVIVSIVAGNWIDLTGGHNGIVGISLPNPLSIPWVGTIGFQTMTAQYYLVLGFLLFTLLIMHRLVYSLQGLSFMAIRNNEVLAESVGIDTFGGKILSFVVGNFFAGMAGGIYASLVGSISPSTASIELTFNWLVYLLLGGAATLAGPIVGAFAIPVLMENLQFLEGYRMVIFGVLLIAVIIYFPRGIMGAISDLRQRVRAS